MATKDQAQKDYADNRAGNYWLEKNADQKSAPVAKDETDDEYMRRSSDNTRKMQLKDQSRQAAQGAAGNTVPSYKKGGIVKKTGLANLHKGERVVPKKDVKRTEKTMKKYGGKR
jgi:hypothetical protein